MNEISAWRRRFIAAPEGPSATTASEPEEVPLSHYWNVLVKRRRIVLTIFVVVSAIGAYCALSATPLYTAIATMKIEPQNPNVTGLGELQPLELRGQYDYHQTQFVLLQSRPVAARVITELKLESNESFVNSAIVSPSPIDHGRGWVFAALRFVVDALPLRSNEQNGGPTPPDVVAAPEKMQLELSVAPYLVQRYRGFLSVEPVKDTRLVNVRFTTPDPFLSQVLANAHVQTFIRMSLEGRFTLTEDARQFLEEKKAELRTRLRSAETALNQFRRAHGVISVEKGENIVIDRLVDLNRQLTVARAQRIEAESLFRTVENKTFQDVAEIMRQGSVQQLKGNVSALEAEKARASTVFKPDHPRIHELNQQIAAARQALENEIAMVVRSIRSTYAAALAKEKALQSESERQQHEALTLRELSINYAVLQEEVNAHRSLYESVLKRLNETNVSNDLAVSNMEIAERAGLPPGPSGPNVVMYLAASVASALLLGATLALVCELFDTTVSTPEMVWRSLGLGTLGVVPHLRFLKASGPRKRKTRQLAGKVHDASTDTRLAGRDLITNHSPLSVLGESYRAIRTSLLLSQPDKPPQVVLLTSPSPGDGKTVTSLNLAIALAHDAHSVLLVDGDMRRGCCHQRLGLQNSRGLSTVLTGALPLEESIQQTPVSNLCLLSRGVPPPNPSELLGSRKMRNVLNELRQLFEFILIDSPPAVAISDAAILSVMTDGVILVVNGQNTSTNYAQKAVERLDTVHARIIGVVLNGVSLDNPYYSYYRAYYYYSDERNGNLAVQ